MSRRILELLLLPPAMSFWLYALGLCAAKWRPRLGRALRLSALALLFVASLPVCGGLLLGALQTFSPLPATGPLPHAEAIVVLSAEADRDGAEYGGAVAGPVTMQRLRYAVHLHRRTGLPLLVSGGAPATGRPSLAALMAKAAREEFGVPVTWLEDRSADTRENAAFSAELLRRDGKHTVLLVTHAWHMPRAAASFARHDLQVIPAPTGFRGPAVQGASSFVPHWTGLKDTCLGLHEWLGRAFYALLG